MDWHERIASRKGEKTREGGRPSRVSKAVASVSVNAGGEMESNLAIYGPLSYWAVTTLCFSSFRSDASKIYHFFASFLTGCESQRHPTTKLMRPLPRARGSRSRSPARPKAGRGCGHGGLLSLTGRTPRSGRASHSAVVVPHLKMISHFFVDFPNHNHSLTAASPPSP